MNVPGPFGILSFIKNNLMLNKFTGAFFYKLFSCAFCTGFWSGTIVFLLFNSFNLINLIAFALSGAIISYVFEIVISLLERFQNEN